MERWSLSVARSLLSMSSRALVATHFMSVSVSRISLDFLGYGDGFFIPIHDECVFFNPLLLVMQASGGQTLAPNRSRNNGKLIFELGLKWSRGGSQAVPECWFLVLSARIILFQQEYALLARS